MKYPKATKAIVELIKARRISMNCLEEIHMDADCKFNTPKSESLHKEHHAIHQELELVLASLGSENYDYYINNR